MKATRLKGASADHYVRLRLPKGVLLVLPVEQYREALYRGKMERRQARRALYDHQQAAREARAALPWLTE